MHPPTHAVPPSTRIRMEAADTSPRRGRNIICQRQIGYHWGYSYITVREPYMRTFGSIIARLRVG
jgi:hypothetical protein